jgi:methylated-DNA-[protein]-cysteine S-methyltransferase
MEQYKAYYQSEIGLLEIIGSEEAIHAVEFVDAEPQNHDQGDLPQAVADCIAQLDEYFKGERQTFSLKLDPKGSEFQKAVWQQLTTIPYGQTVSYLDVAKMIGNEKAVRAVGAANGQNEIVIIIPCHRVIGSDGSLTGYGGGLWRKEWLLSHEGSRGGQQMKLF